MNKTTYQNYIDTMIRVIQQEIRDEITSEMSFSDIMNEINKRWYASGDTQYDIENNVEFKHAFTTVMNKLNDNNADFQKALAMVLEKLNTITLAVESFTPTKPVEKSIPLVEKVTLIKQDLNETKRKNETQLKKMLCEWANHSILCKKLASKCPKHVTIGTKEHQYYCLPKNNKPHGWTIYVNTVDLYVYEGSYTDGLRCGHGTTYFYADDSKYVSHTVQYKNDVACGEGKYVLKE